MNENDRPDWMDNPLADLMDIIALLDGTANASAADLTVRGGGHLMVQRRETR